MSHCFTPVSFLRLPEKRKNHAIVMVKFADTCREAMNSITAELELTLGPGTADLRCRIGLNSGPVTAGVLCSVIARVIGNPK